jgi:lysozyme family protein
MLYYLEKYNGVGYHNRGMPTPYLWAGTTIQEPGKYVADGEFDPDYMDTQPGCCGLLYVLHELDAPSQFERETPPKETTDATEEIA